MPLITTRLTLSRTCSVHNLTNLTAVMKTKLWSKFTIEDRSKIFEMLALANEELWVGHFSYWTEQNMPVFKHAVILNDNEANVESKIAQVIDIAIKECERMYPIFNVVLTKGMNPRQAMYPMMMETIGQA